MQPALTISYFAQVTPHIDVKFLGVFVLYTFQFSTPYRRVERPMARCSALLVFRETQFLSPQMPLKHMAFVYPVVVVYHDGSVVSKYDLAYQNITGVSCWLKLTSMEQVCSLSTLYPYFLAGISEWIRRDHIKKNRRHCWGKNKALIQSVLNLKRLQRFSS